LEQVKITPLGAFPEDYELAVSTDGKTWTDISKVTGSPNLSDAFTVTPEGGSIKARFLRFMGTKLRGGGVDGYLLQFSEIEAYGKPVCDKSVIEDAMAKYMEKIGDESAKEYTDAKAALEDTTLTQSQANKFAEKLMALLPREETTPAETDVPTEPSTNAPDAPAVTDGETDPSEETTPGGEETQGGDSKGCASVAALSLLALLPLCWIALKKKEA
jgi:hypothetical protein